MSKVVNSLKRKLSDSRCRLKIEVLHVIQENLYFSLCKKHKYWMYVFAGDSEPVIMTVGYVCTQMRLIWKVKHSGVASVPVSIHVYSLV